MKNFHKAFLGLGLIALTTLFVSFQSPVLACNDTSQPGNVSCNPSYYNASPNIKVHLTQTSEVKAWFANNQFPIVMTVQEPGQSAKTVYWDTMPNAVTAWDTRTVVVPAGGSVDVTYSFKICYGGNKNACENAYGWMPSNLGTYRYNCGTGCQCSGYPAGHYYGQTQLASFVTTVQNQLNGASFYNLTNSGYSLYNSSQRQAGTADNAISCWNDNYSTGAGADFNDWGTLWTVKAANVAVAPTVTTGSPVTAITQTTAVASGNVTSDGGSAILERGLVYSSTQATPDTSNATKLAVTGTTGAMTFNLSNLTANTTYHVRAFARNAVGTSYGAVVDFKTSAAGQVVAPTVVTGSASGVTTSSFSIAGNVTSDGGAAITERGFVYSATVSTPTTATGTKTAVTGTTGAYSATLTGLNTNTSYYVRAFATNTVGTSYGDVVTVKTSTGGTATPTHTPDDTGFADGFLFYAGAILYGVGIVVFMGARVMNVKGVKIKI